eukprot:722351-Prymnesium_polylepis.3
MAHYCKCKALKSASRPLWNFSGCRGLSSTVVQPEGLMIPLADHAPEPYRVRLQKDALLCARHDIVQSRERLHARHAYEQTSAIIHSSFIHHVSWPRQRRSLNLNTTSKRFYYSALSTRIGAHMCTHPAPRPAPAPPTCGTSPALAPSRFPTPIGKSM